MSAKTLGVAFALCLACEPLTAPAQRLSPPATLQAALDARVAAAAGTAIAVGIIDRGRTSMYFAGSTGNATPLNRHTLFEIGSITKTFTATALASMVLAGSVRLDDPVARYLPPGVRVPQKDGRQITLRNLAEQRSGLPRLADNMDDADGTDPYADYTRARMFAFLNGYTLAHAPGSHYLYSNYGIGLLGQALADAAHVSYAQLIRQRVLAPLGMTDTAFASMPPPHTAGFATGHDLTGIPVPAWHFRSEMPAGGIRSSLSDMLAFLRCNMGQGPLARACLFAQQPRAPGMPGHRIGLVWNVNDASGVIAHGGDTAGFHSFIAIAPNRQRGIVVLSNGPLVSDIAAHLIDPSYPISGCPTQIPAGSAGLASYAGTYCSAMTGLTFSVEAAKRSGDLSIALRPQPPLAYKRIGDDTYYNAAADATFLFARNAGGIVGLYLFQNGTAIGALRLGAGGTPVVTHLPSAFPPTVLLPHSLLAQYVGRYLSRSGSFVVTLRGDQLYVRLTGQPAIPVYAAAKDAFYYKAVVARITFARDAAGRVFSLTLHQNGSIILAKRSE